MSVYTPKTVFSTKAEKYAQYRWDYAPEAIEEIIKVAHLSSTSVIADLGAGTGILTRHFTGKVQRVYAIEPNTEMRQILENELGASPMVSVIDGSAECTTLPDKSVDLITVAQAIHWFDPESARTEMRRILKKDGWLAVLRNYGKGELDHATGQLMTEEYGADFSNKRNKPKETPVPFYFENGPFQKSIHPFQFQQSWEEFIGALTSASFMPNEDHPLFNKLEAEAGKIFSYYSDSGNLSGKVNVLGETELFIGQPSG
jgi:ubiquinone/menaquinone biosynthesis C-methylase UbiE